jgi:hypothetical protein
VAEVQDERQMEQQRTEFDIHWGSQRIVMVEIEGDKSVHERQLDGAGPEQGDQRAGELPLDEE